VAGQPPEPSWQPAGQDQTQARINWPPPPPPSAQEQAQPSFIPQAPAGYPPPGYAQEQGYQSQAQAYQEQVYQPQEQAYPDQTAWQTAVPSMPAARPGQARGAREKGFIGSLFDFSFKSFVTPKIIKVLYVLFTIWTALVALILLIVGFRTGGLAGGLFMLIVIIPIYVLLTLGVYRIILEAFMVIFRIYEETKKISERTTGQL
jgi:Domain of unknown function (DUF4282)